MFEKYIHSKLCKASSWIFGIAIDTNFNIVYFSTGDGELFRYYLNDDNKEPEKLDNTEAFDIAGLVWDGNLSLYACDFGGNRILQYRIDDNSTSIIAGTGVEGTQDGPSDQAEFNGPAVIEIAPNGDLYITQNDAIRRIDLNAKTVSTAVKHPVGGPSGWVGLAIANDGTLYLADHVYTIYRWRAETGLEVIAGSGKSQLVDGPNGEFKELGGLLLSRNGQCLFVVDDTRIRRVDLKSHMVSTLQLGTSLMDPQYMAMDKEGNIYVGEEDGLMKIEDIWRWERFLWIGLLKEEAAYCHLAVLPKDIVKEIAACFRLNRLSQ